MIAVLDYGLGNVSSVLSMLTKVGASCYRAKTPNDLEGSSKIILPGVGAFDHAMTLLGSAGWIAELNEHVLEKRKPVLGICLGMQLFCNTSEEGKVPGLAWIDAEVRKIIPRSREKVPHMGWDNVAITKSSNFFDFSFPEHRYYFVHSYYVDCLKEEDRLMTVDFGVNGCIAAFERDNIVGVQFHPEKSHKFGMSLLKGFVEA